MATQAQFDNHAVWTILDEVRNFIENNDAISEQAGTNAAIDQVRYLTSAALAHRTATDPAPYSVAAMANVQSYVGQVMAELTNFANTANPAFLDNVANHVDSALLALASWPVSILKGGAAAQAHQAFREYRDSAMTAISKLQDELSESINNLSRAQDESETSRNEFANKLRHLEDLAERLEERIASDETRLNSALVTNNEAFLSSQQRHQEGIESWLEQQSGELEEKTKPYMEILNESQTEAQELLAKIEALHASVEKTSSKAAAAILAKDYGSYSTREWASGVLAYTAGFGALIWLAIHLVNTIASISTNFSPTWQYVALKLGLSITAAIAAGVAFQFGSNALTRASTNKRVQLELGTIGTFLSAVEDSSKVEKAMLDFVDRTFGRAWEPTNKKDAEKPAENGSAFSISGDKLIEMIQKLKP